MAIHLHPCNFEFTFFLKLNNNFILRKYERHLNFLVLSSIEKISKLKRWPKFQVLQPFSNVNVYHNFFFCLLQITEMEVNMMSITCCMLAFLTLISTVVSIPIDTHESNDMVRHIKTYSFSWLLIVADSVK